MEGSPDEGNVDTGTGTTIEPKAAATAQQHQQAATAVSSVSRAQPAEHQWSPRQLHRSAPRLSGSSFFSQQFDEHGEDENDSALTSPGTASEPNVAGSGKGGGRPKRKDKHRKEVEAILEAEQNELEAVLEENRDHFDTDDEMAFAERLLEQNGQQSPGEEGGSASFRQHEKKKMPTEGGSRCCSERAASSFAPADAHTNQQHRRFPVPDLAALQAKEADLEALTRSRPKGDGFGIFAKEIRSSLTGHLRGSALNKEIANAWESQSAGQKAHYAARFEQEQEQWLNGMETLAQEVDDIRAAIQHTEAYKEYEASFAQLGPGVGVKIFGIESKPHLNGSIGMCVEFNEQKQRWVVEVNDKLMLFKELNLKVNFEQ